MFNYTGSGVRDLVLGIAGNLFIVVLALGAVTFWAKTEWGRFITLVLGALLVAGFVYMPDQSIAFFKAVIGKFFSS